MRSGYPVALRRPGRVAPWLACAALLLSAPAMAALELVGNVHDVLTGAPVAGANVRLTQQVTFAMDRELATATSTVDGGYHVVFEGDTSGGFLQAYVEHPGYQASHAYFGNAEGTRVEDFVLYPLGNATLTVTVRDRDTLAALPDAIVSAHRGARGYFEPTGPDGAATFTLYGMGPYEVCVDADGFLPGCVGQDSSGQAEPVLVLDGDALSLGIELTRLDGVRGTIRDRLTGEPIAGRRMVFTFTRGEETVTQSATTAADGSYVAPAPDGDWRITAATSFEWPYYLPVRYPDVACAPACAADAGTPLAIGDGGVSGIDFALGPPATLRTGVVDARTGVPLAGVEVEVRSMLPVPALPFARAVTDTDGVAVLDYLPEGLLLRLWTSNGQGYWNQAWPGTHCIDAWCELQGATLALEPGETRQLAPFALVRGNAIRGDMRSADGAPLAAMLEVLHASGVYMLAQRHAGGEYMTPGLPPGIYYARARRTDDDASCILYGGLPCEREDGSERPMDEGTPIQVGTRGDAAGIDFAFPLPGPARHSMRRSASP